MDMDNIVTLPPVVPETPAPKATPAKKHRVITLTNRAPIKIAEDEWPVVAQGACGYEHPAQDGSGWDIKIRVREQKVSHRYGHTVIYATYVYHPFDIDDGEGQAVRVGRLIQSLDVEAADDYYKQIVEVAEELRVRIANENLAKHVTYALDQCFADMKPTSY